MAEKPIFLSQVNPKNRIVTKKPSLLSMLKPSVRSEIMAKIPINDLIEYETRLDKIHRFQHDPSLPIKPGYVETVCDHVGGMLSIQDEMEERFPYLAQAINLDDTSYMILMHDSGEIFTGDAPPFGRTVFWQRKKRQEPKMAHRYLINPINDDKMRAKIQQLYDRFEVQNQDDKEALLARFLDKVQATLRTGIKYAFDFKAAGMEKPSPELTEHVEEGAGILVDAAFNLYRVLPAPAAYEFKGFVFEELEKFHDIGFDDLADAKTELVQQFSPALISLPDVQSA